MTSVKVASTKGQGLGDGRKRREVFNWLKAKKMAIYMLQEVHCSDKTSDLWAWERGYKALFSSYSSQKAGVCILFNNN